MTSSGSARRVLVVDGDDESRSRIARFLSSHGIVVTTTDTWHSAARFLTWQKYDAVIIDAKLQGVDGLELALLIHDQYPAVTIIGTGVGESKDRFMGVGAKAYLQKPVDLSELETLLK